jgi:uncharacterized protein (TIGR03083 family)
MRNGEPLTNGERLEWLQREADALVDLASAQHFDLQVPSCPGWTVADVLTHVGGAHRWCLSVVAGGEATSARPSSEPKLERSRLLPWYREGVTAVVQKLRATPPATPTWTPVPAGTSAWWTRKIVVETALHRWDAADAVARPGGGQVEPVPSGVAADGIDEFFGDFLLGLVQRTGADAPGGPLELHCTDGSRRWKTDLGGAGGAETTTVAATASDLVLWLWNRLPNPGRRLEISGDRSVVAKWQKLKI